MTQQDLDGAQIHVGLEQPGRGGAAKIVGRDPALQPGTPSDVVQLLAN